MIGLFANASALWTVVAIGLLGVIAHKVFDDRSTRPGVLAAATGGVAAEETTERKMAALEPAGELIDIIVARPLFKSSRRPSTLNEQVQAPVHEKPNDKPLFKLIGTMSVGDKPIAILDHPTEGAIRRRPGERIGNWTIIAVKHRSISLRGESGLEMLTLREDQDQPSKPSKSNRPDTVDPLKVTPKKPQESPEATSTPIRMPM